MKRRRTMRREKEENRGGALGKRNKGGKAER